MSRRMRMKLSKVLGASLLGCMLLMSGCSGSSEKKAEDLTLEDLTINMDGTALSVYVSYEALLKDWELDEDTPEKLDGLEDERIYLTSKGDSKSYLSLSVFNPEDKEIDMKKAKILSIRAHAEDRKIEYEFPAGIKFGSSKMEDVIKAFGTPMEYSVYDNETTLIYASSTAYDRAEYFYFNFENGKLTDVSMEGCEKKSAPSDKISFDTKTVIGYEPLEMPMEKGKNYDDLVSGSFLLDDITIDATTPITTLIEKGWKTKYVDAYDGETSVSLEKNRVSIDVTVSGEVSEASALTKDNLILDFSAYDRVDSISFTKEFKASSSASDVLSAFGIPASIGYDDDGVRIRYEEFDKSFALSLSYTPEGELEYFTVKFDYDLGY